MATPQQETEARALLAKGDALGAQAQAQTGVQYNPQYSNATPPPSIPQTISSTNLQPQTPLALPAYQPPQIPSTADILASYNAPTETETKLKGEQDTLMGNVKSILDKQGTEAQRKAELETQAGIPDLQKNLNQYTGQINAINASAFQATQNAENRLAPTFAISGEQANIERQKSAQTFGLAAAASATQNNIALAETNVQRALDAEFGGLESQLKYQSMLLDINHESFDKEEQKQAFAAQTQLQERQRVLEEQKSEREAVYNVMMQAAQQGADPTIVNKIANSSTVGEAIINAGPALGAEFAMKLKQQKFDNDIKLQQLNMQKTADAAQSAGLTATSGLASDLTSILANGKLSAATKTNVGNILGVITSAETLAKSNPDGSFSGFYPGSGIVHAIIPNALKKTATITNEGYIDAINLRVQQWASGASLTKQQIDQVNKMVPSVNDSDRVVQTKLNTLVNVMNTYIQGSLASEGIGYQPQQVDLFNKGESLADIFGTSSQPNWGALQMK